MAIDESIIRRIQKLLAHAKGKGTSEEEAANAMGMATELLTKHNLDLAIIEATAVAGGTVVVQEKREQTKINKSAMYKWQRELCAEIARANFCWYWTADIYETKTKRDSWGDTVEREKRTKRHMIIGKEVNVVAVTIMYEYLAQIIEELLPYPNNERISKSAVSWREGCADRLCERIRAKARELVVANEKANEEATRRANDAMEASRDAMPTQPQQEGPKTSTGVVLRNLFQSEYAANYDAIVGREGAHAEALVKMEEKRAQETPEEKAKREKKQQKEWEKQRKEQQRQIERQDRNAYYKGRIVGGTISLNDRLSDTKEKP